MRYQSDQRCSTDSDLEEKVQVLPENIIPAFAHKVWETTKYLGHDLPIRVWHANQEL
jgi:hypothetical protein